MAKVARNLNDILGEIQVRSAQWTRIELKGAAGLQVPRGKQIAVHFVLDGNPIMSAKSQPNLALRPGDVMIVLDRQSHSIRNLEGAELYPFQPAKSQSLFGDTSEVKLQGKGADAQDSRSILLTGMFRVRWPVELSQWRLLPPVLHGNRNFRSDAAGREASSIFAQLASRPGGPICITRYMEFLIARELQQVLERSPGLVRASASNDVHIEQALVAIADDPAAQWSVATLAQHVGMSRSTFAESFIRYAGVTPMALVFQHRMELAAQYLKQHALSIKEIASLSGYGSVASFTRAFSGHFGHSPALYRRLTTEESDEPA
jgi:AraC-like DNA-binding protein